MGRVLLTKFTADSCFAQVLRQTEGTKQPLRSAGNVSSAVSATAISTAATTLLTLPTARSPPLETILFVTGMLDCCACGGLVLDVYVLLVVFAHT